MAPNTFVVVGDDILTPEARSCLLRAARKELDFLMDERDRMALLPTRYAGGPIGVVEQEIECLSQAIGWVWKHANPGRPPPA